MRAVKKQQARARRNPSEGDTRLEDLLAGEATLAHRPGRSRQLPVSREAEMDVKKQRWIDVSGWSLMQVHDALASHARDGWELNRVIEASTGEMVLCLILREVA